MVFGVFLSPLGWLLVLVAALFSIVLPFAAIEWMTSYLPASVRVPATVGLSYIAFPMLLCALYRKRVFGTGRGSVFFWVYTTLFTSFGLMFLYKGITGSPPEDVIENLTGGVIVTSVGVVMYIWARKTKRRFGEEIQRGIALEREEQINMQAEAIRRADASSRRREREPS